MSKIRSCSTKLELNTENDGSDMQKTSSGIDKKIVEITKMKTALKDGIGGLREKIKNSVRLDLKQQSEDDFLKNSYSGLSKTIATSNEYMLEDGNLRPRNISKKSTSLELMLEDGSLSFKEGNISNVPNEIIFPEELNAHLKGQLDFLTHANEVLRKSVIDKEGTIKKHESTITKLDTKIQELEKNIFESSSTNQYQNLASTKIVELSKKLRDKTSEVESWKTKCSKLKQKLINYDNLTSTQDTVPTPKSTESEDATTDYEQEIKNLNEKLYQTTNKLFEVKNINLQLKNDLKTANKLLQQEIGDSFTSIQNLQNSQSNWRGRSQHILSLQQKNAELQEKLLVLSEKGSDISRTPPKPDNRKLTIEQQQKEITVAKTEIDDIKKKLNGSRARNKVLESDYFSFKMKINTLTEKSKQDEKMIKMLSNQISSLEDAQANLRKDNKLAMQKLEEDNKVLNIETNKYKCLVDNLKTTITERDCKIKQMKMNFCSAETGVPTHHNSISTTPRSTNQDGKVKILDVEVDRLLELNQVLNERLENERSCHSETSLNYKKERQKAAKLEIKLTRMELESNMSRSNSNSYSRSCSKLNTPKHSETSLNVPLESLKYDLELAEEKISSLTTRLEILQKEKEFDLQRFQATITEVSKLLKTHELPVPRI